MSALAIQIAIAVAVWLTWARATIARYTVPRLPAAHVVSLHEDPCGTYPDMPECHDGRVRP